MAYQGKKPGKNSGETPKYAKKSFGQAQSSFHKATCTKCGKGCEVPFKPTGTKPVLCRNCFQNKEEYSPTRKFDKKDFGKKPFADRPPRQSTTITQDQFEILNAKLDKILGML